MENLTSIVFALGGCAVLAAWIAAYVLIVNDRIAGPRPTGPRPTTTSDEAADSDARELVTASSN